MKRFLFVTGIIACALRLQAADCVMTVNATDGGWYNNSGFHDPNNNNYFAGYSGGSGTEFRDWFVFDLPSIGVPIVAATLRVLTFDVVTTTNGSTIEFHRVSTPLATLTNGGTGLTSVFDDLGSGTIYGARTVFGNEANSAIVVPLNSNALAAISSVPGQRFAIGGALAGLSAGSTNDEHLFGYSYISGANAQLILTLASTSAPVILSQPPTNYFAPSGSNVKISATTCGGQPLAYRWYFNGASLASQTNASLTIGSATTNNAGNYFFIATNGFGSVTSSVVRLIVDARPPSILSLNYLPEVEVGQEIKITASVDGLPYPAIRWQFNGADIFSATGATNILSIPNAQLTNGGTYSIIASNTYGIASHSFTIGVVPFVIYGPYDTELDLGADAYLPVSISALAPSTYQWRFNGTNIAGANGRALSLFTVSNANNGDYDVVIANSFGVRTSALAHATVTGARPRLYPIDVLGNLSIGGDAVLNTKVGGSPPIFLQWFGNGSPLPNATNEQLILPNLTTNMSGTYFLAASNAFGVTTGSLVSLTVAGGAPSSSGTLAQTIYAGDSFRLASGIQGGPPPTMQWQLDHIDIPGATNSTLLVTNAALAQAGQYHFMAANSFGSSTSIISITTVLPRRALDHWTWRNLRPQANDLEHIAFGNGRYVAAGEGGSIVTSTNATDWTVMALNNDYAAVAAAFGNGAFAVLLKNPHNEESASLLLTSADGVNWTPRDIPVIGIGSSLDFVNGEFLICGYGVDGIILCAASPDALTWQTRVLAGPVSPLQSIAYGNGIYVGLHFYELFSSRDGVHWTSRLQGFRQVRFVNGIFIATGYTGQLWTSSDGVRWAARNSGTIAHRLGGATFGKGRFVVPGDDGTVLTSSDGANWSTNNPGVSQNLKAVLFDGAQFVLCGNNGLLLTSPDGVTWTDHRAGKTEDLYGIVYTNGLFVAVGYEGTILTSSDGVTWTQRASPNSRDLHGIIYAGGQFVAVGRKGTVLTSPNGINWTSRPTPTTNYLERISYGNGLYVAVGSAATILTSPDGVNWQLRTNTLRPDTELEGVTFGAGNLFVAVGGYFLNVTFDARGITLVSTNGTDWVQEVNAAGKILRAVTFGGNYFQAVGNDGITIFSSTGTNWFGSNIIQSVPPYENLRQIKYAAGRFVAVGNEGTVVSLNESGWSSHASIVSQNLHDIAYGANKFVAVGNAGTIVQSDEVLPEFSAVALAGGALRFDLRGGLEAQYRVQSSDNLLTWTNVAVFTNQNGASALFSTATNAPRQFYRAVYP